jgi:hypothetical protein
MKIFFTVMFLALTRSYAQEVYLMQDAINRPATSLRCKEMLSERDDKVRVQQKLNALMQRNLDLIKKNPKANQSMQSRLQASLIKVKNELHLTTLNIQNMEENIVRSGCPGIAL